MVVTFMTLGLEIPYSFMIDLSFVKSRIFGIFYNLGFFFQTRVSVQGVESLWGDWRFIPADWGS